VAISLYFITFCNSVICVLAGRCREKVPGSGERVIGIQGRSKQQRRSETAGRNQPAHPREGRITGFPAYGGHNKGMAFPTCTVKK